MNPFRKILIEIFHETNGKGSEKRFLRILVVAVMLGLSIAHFCVKRNLDIELLLTWLGFAGWDGWRSLQEKKIKNEKPDTVNPDGNVI